MFNRLGTVNPNGMIYALKQDVVAIDPAKGLVAGNVRLRADKRPRPIVLTHEQRRLPAYHFYQPPFFITAE